jgi:hypothetical protein
MNFGFLLDLAVLCIPSHLLGPFTLFFSLHFSVYCLLHPASYLFYKSPGPLWRQVRQLQFAATPESHTSKYPMAHRVITIIEINTSAKFSALCRQVSIWTLGHIVAGPCLY